MELRANNGVLLKRKDSLDLLSKVDRLPSLPCVLIDVRNVMEDPESGIFDLSAAIEKDQSTSAMVLKFANSAVYNPNGRKYSTLNDAVARLGMAQTADIANAMSIMQGVAISKDANKTQAFWIHCFGVGLMARLLASIVDPSTKIIHPENAFMIGLLHEIGRVAIASNVDYCYFNDDVSILSGLEAREYDEKNYGISHSEAAGFIMNAWGFPDQLTENIVHFYDGDTPILKVCRYAESIVDTNCAQINTFEGMIESVSEYVKGKDAQNNAINSLCEKPDGFHQIG